MFRVTIGRGLVISAVTIALVVAFFHLPWVHPNGPVSSSERDPETSKEAGADSNAVGAGCQSAKPIIDRLVDVFGLSMETAKPASAAPEIPKIDTEVEHILQLYRDADVKAREGQETQKETVIAEGYHLFQKDNYPGSVLMYSSRTHTSLDISPGGTIFKRLNDDTGLKETCYRNDTFRAYVVQHPSGTHDRACVLITVVRDAQVLCAQQYEYVRVFFPRPQSAGQLQKALSVSYVLTGSFDRE